MTVPIPQNYYIFIHFGLDFQNIAKNIFGVRQSSLSMILKKFLIFGKLSLGGSYKKMLIKNVRSSLKFFPLSSVSSIKTFIKWPVLWMVP